MPEESAYNHLIAYLAAFMIKLEANYDELIVSNKELTELNREQKSINANISTTLERLNTSIEHHAEQILRLTRMENRLIAFIESNGRKN